MSLGIRSKTHGDTLVEVLFATAVFSLVAVSCLSIMNQDAATAQRSLEITLVRNEMDAQAEALRFLNASYISAYQPGLTAIGYTGSAQQWRTMQEAISSSGVTDTSNLTDCSRPREGSFILNARRAIYINPVGKNQPGSAVTFSQVTYDGSDNFTSAQGIWIEAVEPNMPSGNSQDNADYIDFRIRACWDSPGQSVPVTLGTIVRLYEPR